MSKRPATPKIPLETGRKLIIRGRPIIVRGTVRYFRKESNEELLHQSMLKRGFARLQVKMQIRDHRNGGYLGWQGWNAYVDVTSVKQAAQFQAELEHAIARVVSNVGAQVKFSKETKYGNAKHRANKGRS